MAYNYYFKVRSLYFIPGFHTITLDRYTYRPEIAPILQENHILFPVSDFKVIFSHVYEVTEQEGQIIVSGGVKQACIETQELDGVKVFAIDRVLQECFGYRRIEKNTVERNHQILLTCDDTVQDFPTETVKYSKYLDNLVRGKKQGDQYETFWFEEGTKLVPYRIYLPTYYDGKTPLPICYWLHGGIGHPSQGFDQSKNMLQYYAEKYGYIVVGVDGFIQDGTYGYSYPPNPGDPSIDYSCPENPRHFSEEKLMEFRLSERCLERTIEHICTKYCVDTDNMFLFGNSMGGEGTFWFASTHPGMFRAICPAGAMINTRLVDLATLRGIPILFVGGTEDRHGFDYLYEGVEVMKEFGLDIEPLYVGGGGHSFSWVQELDTIYKFFNQHRKVK